MKLSRISCLLSLFVLFSIHFAQAGSPVWKVSKGNKHLFIGGTIHVLSQADYPLPLSFEKAYSQSSQVVFETDIRKLKSPEFQKTLMQRVIYSDGRTLQQVLNAETYRALEEFFSSRGVPMANLVKFKPGMISITVTMMELQRLGLVGAGVDEFYNLRAINDQKEMGQLETAKEQLELIATMGDGRENELINYTLRDVKELPLLMKSLKELWRRGDMEKLEKLILEPFRQDFPKVYYNFLVHRNNGWMPQIEAMLETEDTEFVLVGTLHLVGEDGVIERLVSKGYEVEML